MEKIRGWCGQPSVWDGQRTFLFIMQHVCSVLFLSRPRSEQNRTEQNSADGRTDRQSRQQWLGWLRCVERVVQWWLTALCSSWVADVKTGRTTDIIASSPSPWQPALAAAAAALSRWRLAAASLQHAHTDISFISCTSINQSIHASRSQLCPHTLIIDEQLPPTHWPIMHCWQWYLCDYHCRHQSNDMTTHDMTAARACVCVCVCPFHSLTPGLKPSFFCNWFPSRPSFSSSGLTTRISRTVYRYLSAHPFFAF